MAPVTSFLAAAACIAGGCILNNYVLELIISKRKNAWADPGAGGLLTLMQFLFITLFCTDGLLEWDADAASKWLHSGWGGSPLRLRPRVVPLRHYAGQTVIFFSMSYLNNLAFKFGISQPTHMVFRSANLVVTCAMGAAAFGERYSAAQLAVIAAITAGAATSTAAEAYSTGAAVGVKSAPLCATCSTPLAGSGGDAMSGDALFTWGMGVVILCAVLLLQSGLSHYQNWTNRSYGRAPREAMFFSHALSLPMFIMTLGDLHTRYNLWNASPTTAAVCDGLQSEGVSLPAGAVLALLSRLVPSLPIMWTLVIVNAVSQYLCVTGVYLLVSITSALTVNVALTVRKSVSLLLSVYLFNNTFTPLHWLGAVLVFGGAMVYSMLPSLPRASSSSNAKPKTDEVSNGAAPGGGANAPHGTQLRQAEETPAISNSHARSLHLRVGTGALEKAEGGGFRHRNTPSSTSVGATPSVKNSRAHPEYTVGPPMSR